MNFANKANITIFFKVLLKIAIALTVLTVPYIDPRYLNFVYFLLLTDIFLYLSVFILFIYNFLLAKNAKSNVLILLIFLLLLVKILFIFFSNSTNYFLFLGNLKFYINILLSVFLFINTKSLFSKNERVFLVMASILQIVVISYLNLFLYFSLGKSCYYCGYWIIKESGLMRLVSVVGDSTNLAFVLFPLITFLIYTFLFSVKPLQKLIISILFVFCSMPFIHTFSLTAIFALIIFFIFLFLYKIFSENNNIKFVFISLILVLPFTLFIYSIFQPVALYFWYLPKSILSHLSLVYININLGLNNFFGVGAGQFGNYLSQNTSYLNSLKAYDPGAYNAISYGFLSHSHFLQNFSEGGILSFILFFIIQILFLKSLYTTYLKDKKFGFYLLILYISFIYGSVFYHFYTPFLYIYLIFMANIKKL